MLNQIGESIVYSDQSSHNLGIVPGLNGSGSASSITLGGSCYQPYTYWGNYPVYVNDDKTKKAISVLQKLMDEKVIECRSVPKFIELVEKISKLI